MRFDELELENFRNYSNTQVNFSDGVNVIKGDNAQGKTNMLEAMYIICAGRSFRAKSDRELIRFGSDFASIKAAGESDGRERKAELTIRPGLKRVMTMNGVKRRTALEFAGTFSAVLFRPEDLDIIRGGPAERRRLIDRCIAQLRPRYAAALREFNKALDSKTRILKDALEKPSLLQLQSEYDYRIAEMSAELIRYRASFIKRLSPEAEVIHREFAENEALELKYKTIKTISDPLRPVRELIPAIMEHIKERKTAEAASGMCLVGAHKDDIEITINGISAREFASQGQMRTAALSIKLAEREIHFADKNEYPILLLDDVLSELDPKRQDYILNRISGAQVFITCCEDDRIAERTGGKVIEVTGGTVKREQ